METGGIKITQRDINRHHILRMVLEDKLVLSVAAKALGVSYRHAKRLKKKLTETGISGLLHGNRGRRVWNKTPDELKSRVVALSDKRYPDFNDTHFWEMLSEREGIAMSRETVRAIRRNEGIKPKVKRKPRKHHKRRDRKESAGLMMLWDGSPHRWFGKEYAPCCLMVAMDDGTGAGLSLVFVDHEGSWPYLKTLERVTSRYGIPASVYQDRHSALKRNDDCWSIEEELAGEQYPTQVGVALEALGIEPIFALSPEAKGRVERLIRTLQDRLAPLLRLNGITNIEAANAYVEESSFLDDFNSKFAVEAVNTQSAWRKVPKNLDLQRVLSLQYEATVGNDNAIRFYGMVIDIGPGPSRRSYAGVRAELRQTLDGGWRVYHEDRLIATAPPTEIVEPIRARKRRRGVTAAHDSQWVYLASAQPQPNDRSESKAHTAKGTVRRARTGRAIGATRIA
jgi:transposase